MADTSEQSHARLDVASRRAKGAKIVAVLRHYADLSEADVLDIGTGAGAIAAALAADAKSVTSVDIFDERQVTDGYTFVRLADETLPFHDAAFDVVVYNHVIEHVPDQHKHISEIARVLKPGGIVYLATPNKYGPTDPHYELPLLSWLPRPLALLYLKAVKGKSWDIYPLSPGGVRRLVAGKLQDEQLTARIVKDPTAYGMEATTALKAVGALPLPLLKLLQPFMPTQIHVLKKPA